MYDYDYYINRYSAFKPNTIVMAKLYSKNQTIEKSVIMSITTKKEYLDGYRFGFIVKSLEDPTDDHEYWVHPDDCKLILSGEI